VTPLLSALLPCLLLHLLRAFLLLCWFEENRLSSIAQFLIVLLTSLQQFLDRLDRGQGWHCRCAEAVLEESGNFSEL